MVVSTPLLIGAIVVGVVFLMLLARGGRGGPGSSPGNHGLSSARIAPPDPGAGHERQRIAYRMSDEERFLTPDGSAAVISAIRENRKIEAIKLVRQDTGLGLKEAKDIVDAVTPDIHRN